jgi:hypothetical protein
MEKTYYKSSLDHIIAQKISRHKSADDHQKRTYNEEDYITSDFIKNKLIKYNNRCQRCNKELKLTGYQFRDPNQFSVDRILNSLPHIKLNCQIVCWECNKDRQNKHLPDTEYEKKKIEIMRRKGLF